MITLLINVSCEIIPNLGVEQSPDNKIGFESAWNIGEYKEDMRPEYEDTAKDLMMAFIPPGEDKQTKEGMVMRLRPGKW